MKDKILKIIDYMVLQETNKSFGKPYPSMHDHKKEVLIKLRKKVSRVELPIILPKPTQVKPGQLWLSDKDYKYNKGCYGETLYLTKSKEPDEPWVCIVFQEWEFGGYFRELNEEEVMLMKYAGHIKDLSRSI